MTVYLIGQITIHNRDLYDKYDAAFMDIFDQFDGTLLAADESGLRMEGKWEATRTVLISFPSAESARAWFMSPAYQKIAKWRLEASTTNSVMVTGFERIMEGQN